MWQLVLYGCHPPAEAIWDGSYWGLVTTVFVHHGILHVTLNVCWLWLFGNQLERGIGSFGWLLLFVASAMVSSGAQLVVTGIAGHGASGVVCAFFGFMWVARRRVTGFHSTLNRDMVELFLGWVIVCLVMAHFGLWHIGNAAHISGLAFGIGVAVPYVRSGRREEIARHR